jgi:FtsP/CotA-like multicopper oxidase with cupredoxin domain
MNVDRRQFIQAGAAAILAGGACGRDGGRKLQPNGTLQVSFEGLYLLQRQNNAVTVHLVDATKVGMAAHVPQLIAWKSALDTTQTSAPTIKATAGSDEKWIWHLQGVNLTMPPSASGTNDLETDSPSSEDSMDIPATDQGWHSPARMADMRVLCGATTIATPSAIASSLALTHGKLTVQKPVGVGSQTVWVFTDPYGNQLKRGALSDNLLYTSTAGASALTINVGTTGKIVFLPNAQATVDVTNLPASSLPPCPAPCTPNMNHFAALASVVDKKFLPTITVASFNPTQPFDLGADYCPGGSI